MFPSFESLTRDPFADSTSPSSYEAIASSQDPLQSLVRSQIDKEEEAYRQKLRQIVLGNASQNPQDLINKRLQEYENQPPGKKAANFLTELFSAIGKGANYVPYRDILRERAIQEYKLNQANVNATVGVLRAEAQAQAAEERARQAETKMQLDQQYRLLQEQRKSLADETKSKDVKSKIETRLAKAQQDLKNGELLERKVKVGEGYLKIKEAGSIENQAALLAKELGFEEGDQMGFQLARSFVAEATRGSSGGGGDKTITKSSMTEVPFQGYDAQGRPTPVQMIPRPTTSTTTVSGGGKTSFIDKILALRPDIKEKMGTLYGTIQNIGKPSLPPNTDINTPMSSTPTPQPRSQLNTNQVIRQPSPTSPISNTTQGIQGRTIIDTRTGEPVISRDAKYAEERRKSGTVLGLFDATLSSALDAYKSGELDSIVGPPGYNDKGAHAGRLGGVIRSYTGTMTPNQQAVVGFFTKTRAEDFFANGGKNLTANEIAQVGPYWPSLNQSPRDFTRNLMLTYYMTALSRWKQNHGLGPEDELPIGLFIKGIQKDVDSKIGSAERGSLDTNEVKAFQLFDQLYNSYQKKTSSSSTPSSPSNDSNFKGNKKKTKTSFSAGGIEVERID